MNTWTHLTVLLNEAIDALVTRPDGQYVDATFGRGGHSRALLAQLGAAGRLLAFDKDPEALVEAAQIRDERFSIRHQGFAALAELPPASVTCVAAPASVIVAGMMFIAGEPMKRATNRLAGRS